MNWRKIKQQNRSSESDKKPVRASVHYAGFWSRLLAFIIDIFMIGLPVSLIIMTLFGYDQMQSMSALDALEGIKPVNAQGEVIEPDPTMALTQITLFATIVISLWHFDRGQTPGKRLSKSRVVDSRSLGQPRLWQLIVRFFAYFLSFISFIFLVGILLLLLDPKKRAPHDMVSGTVVIYDEK